MNEGSIDSKTCHPLANLSDWCPNTHRRHPYRKANLRDVAPRERLQRGSATTELQSQGTPHLFSGLTPLPAEPKLPKRGSRNSIESSHRHIAIWVLPAVPLLSMSGTFLRKHSASRVQRCTGSFRVRSPIDRHMIQLHGVTRFGSLRLSVSRYRLRTFSRLAQSTRRSSNAAIRDVVSLSYKYSEVLIRPGAAQSIRL